MSIREKGTEALISLLKACVYLLAFYFSQILVGVIIALAVSADAVEFVEKNAMEVSIISNLVAVLLCIWLVKVFERKDAIEGFSINADFKKPICVLVACAALGFFAQYITSYWINTAKLPDSWIEQLEDNTDMLTSGGLDARIIALAVVAPLAEEIIFRACIQGTLSKAINKWISIGAGALIFGLAHGAYASIIVATLLGFFMGWLFAQTRSIIPSMIFHVAYNLTSVFLTSLNTIFFIISCVCFALGLAYVIYLSVKNKNVKGENNEAL